LQSLRQELCEEIHRNAKIVCGFFFSMIAVSPVCSQEEISKERRALAVLEKHATSIEGPFPTLIVRDEKAPGKPIIKLRVGTITDPERNTDPVLSCLRHFPQLKSLDLSGSPITDDSLKHLEALSNLETLTLSLTPISDKGLQHLKTLKRLEELNLAATDVRDEGLDQLTNFPKLKKLYLTRDLIGDDAVHKLQKSIPGLKIERGNNNTADKRVRKFFAIPDKKPLTAESIRAAVLNKIPLETNEKQVRAALKTCGVTEDKFSDISSFENGLACPIGYDPESGYIVHTHYFIGFELDAAKKLKEIKVKVWYTGP
jgi:hypothetical protein